jgi:AcrR family transcriptional regulator
LRYEISMEQHASESGWRGSPEAWLGAAYELLLESGVDSVKIQPLAQRLNLSRTSFYWFFKDREELLAALLALWRDKNTGNFIRQAGAYAETLVEALLNVSDCWFDQGLFDSRLEFAVRSWALQSPKVQAEVQEADQQRLKALSELFRRYGQDEMSADVRARTVYLTQIGYISMQTSEEISIRMQRMPSYMEVFTGLVPKQRELDRFFARHGFPPSYKRMKTERSD